mmetsp:Transcript_22345/g.28906  ORF Transcript_22345/g.28906 Transcript_22345/m.28906 type:complete len:118 (+) Transcript_22345:70-423(+)
MFTTRSSLSLRLLIERSSRLMMQQKREKTKFMSKTASKFVPLTSKRVKKGYYKGKGCRSTGRLTSKARFIVDPKKLVKVVVPDLTDFTLKPYVAMNVPNKKFPLPETMLAEVGTENH